MVHTCAASYISPQAVSVGPASVQAVNRKALKYAALPTTHVFQPVAIETRGPLDPSACDFINWTDTGPDWQPNVGHHWRQAGNGFSLSALLFQRLSMAIQRFNLVAFLGTFHSAIEDEA